MKKKRVILNLQLNQVKIILILEQLALENIAVVKEMGEVVVIMMMGI